MNSCLYEGWVNHRRFAPTENHFRYRLFFLYLDLAELGRVFHGRWLWSADRPNWAWFRRQDHLGCHTQPLDESVRDLVQATGLDRPAGPIRLLTQLRYGGYVFNPVSFYYCFDESDQLEAVVAEVNNTPWGERHCYVLRPEDLHGSASQLLAKEFHVSPFMSLDMHYRWLLGTPGGSLNAHLENVRDGVSFFDVTMQLERQPLDSRHMSSILMRYPLVTGKIVAAIYWQALRLWWKGTPFVAHPRYAGPTKGALNAPTSIA